MDVYIKHLCSISLHRMGGYGYIYTSTHYLVLTRATKTYIYLVLTKSSVSYAAVVNTPKILVAHNKIDVFLTSHVHLESATIMLYLCRLDVG